MCVATRGLIVLAALGSVAWSGGAQAQEWTSIFGRDPAPSNRVEPLAMATPGARPALLFEQQIREPEEPSGESADQPAHLRRQVVNYDTREPAGTVIIDTPGTYLYYVLGHGRAIRYGIGVGRDGFRWSGIETISKMSEWPDWYPPAEMISRQPYLPRFVAGGESNPLGARALYLGRTEYRIHGTNAPSTIGKRVSSGCIRMLNDDVADLYKRVKPGTRVVVLPDQRHNAGARAAASTREVVAAERSVTTTSQLLQPAAAAPARTTMPTVSVTAPARPAHGGASAFRLY
jgi:lipoprotein-anchoring transpeptidase ErfK/SrfK